MNLHLASVRGPSQTYIPFKKGISKSKGKMFKTHPEIRLEIQLYNIQPLQGFFGSGGNDEEVAIIHQAVEKLGVVGSLWIW